MIRTYASGFSFAGDGELLTMTYGNGATENFSYNDRIQLTQQSLVKNSSVIQQYDYGYGIVNLNDGSVDTRTQVNLLVLTHSSAGVFHHQPSNGSRDSVTIQSGDWKEQKKSEAIIHHWFGNQNSLRKKGGYWQYWKGEQKKS
jgi:hypothetical protein